MIGVASATPASFVVSEAAVPRTAGLPFGIGLMAWALGDRPDLLDATIAATPDLVSISFGDPAPWVPRLHDVGITVAAPVSTVADVHWPGRALVNEFTRAWHGREDELARDDVAAQRVVDARRTGDVEHAPLYAGESVGLVTEERSATDVVRDLTAGAEQALRRAAGLLG